MSNKDRPLFRIAEQQRRETAKTLHDGVAQTTLQLGLQAGICRKLLERNNHEMLSKELAHLEERIQIASQQVRQLIQDLRPPALEEGASLADHIQYLTTLHAERGGAPVRVDMAADLSLAAGHLLPAFRTVQALLATMRDQDNSRALFLRISNEQGQLILKLTADEISSEPSQFQERPPFSRNVLLTALQLSVTSAGGTLKADPEGRQVAIHLPA